jgi:hypothetical protein
LPLKVISRERSRIRTLFAPLVATLCAVSFAISPVGQAHASDEQHFLDFTDYNFGVVFISGNLTATVTREMPQVVFKHSTDPVAPSFTMRLPFIYLYNDTNDDGVFSRSEAVYTASLDSHYNVAWNMSTVEFANGPQSGEYARLRMAAPLSLYDLPTDNVPIIDDWANITFWFQITENPVTYSNSYGSYTVVGRTEMRMNFTLDILKKLNFSGLAVEHLLKAGGSTNMFQIREASSAGGWTITTVSSRVNEEQYGLNFTHKLNQTSLPDQDINFAQDDGTIQAFYHYSSEPLVRTSGDYHPAAMNSSYYTTGTGMMLYVSYAFSNDTVSISHDSFLGIDENGFVGRVRDWLRESLPMIMIVSGSIVAVVAFAILGSMLLRRRRQGDANGPKPTETEETAEDRARPR